MRYVGKPSVRILVVIIIVGIIAGSVAGAAFATRMVFPFQCRSAYYQPPNLSSEIPSELFSIPVQVTLVNGDNYNITHSDSYLYEVMGYVNSKWKTNANITFNITSIHRLDLVDAPRISQNDETALHNFGKMILGDKYGDDVIDFIIIKSFSDQYQGGKALPRDRAFFDTEFQEDFKTKWSATHELGHLLNLCDVIQPDNLMQDYKLGFNVDYKLKNLPTNLTNEQVLTVRNWAYNVYCIDQSCIINE